MTEGEKRLKAWEILTKARGLITSPDHWTKGTFARDKDGNRTPWESMRACQFCAVGALYRSLRDSALDQRGETAELCVASLATAIPGDSITTVNDVQGHAATLLMFDKAIAALA